MSEPDYLVCLDCDTPCYVFEWEGGKVQEVVCAVCGNDDSDNFALPEDYEEMSGAPTG